MFWEQQHNCSWERLTEPAEHAKIEAAARENNRNQAAECDRVIQYAFFCVLREQVRCLANKRVKEDVL